MKRAFSVDDFVAIRTAMLPLQFLDDDEPADPTRARDALLAKLRAAVAVPAIREALFLASPTLEAALQPWLDGELAPHKHARMDHSVLRYLTRMASRATPFGLFAGSSMGVWAATTKLDVPGLYGARRHTRLDMDLLAELAEGLSAASASTYRPNDSLYELAGQYRYQRCQRSAAGERQFSLEAIEVTPALQTVLARAAQGADRRELAETLVDEDVDLEAALGFIQELVDAQLLRADGEAPLVGADTLHALAAHPSGEILRDVISSLDAMDRAGPGRAMQAYRDVAQRLRELPVAAELQHAFQVDLTSPCTVQLGPLIRDAVEAGIELLQRITPPPRRDAFATFRAAFETRYGGRWVPLLEALDPDSGIGFEDERTTGELPLLEGLHFPGQDEPGKPSSSRDAFLVRRLDAQPSSHEWELTDADLDALSQPKPAPLPDAFAAMVILSAQTADDLDLGHYQFLLEHYHGPSGARLLGRFSALDPELEARVRAHVRKEAALQPDAILAEVAHLPPGRAGNLIRRPRLRDWQIPFLGAGGTPDRQDLPLGDLQVTVVGTRVLLRSEKLGREVKPRLTSAHDYGSGLAVYRFLGKLQDQDGHTGGWSWGSIERAFLPRVRRGRHVLARASWRIEVDDLRDAITAVGAEAVDAFQRFRHARRLPRFVVLADRDNHLRVDLDHPLCVETLLHQIARRRQFQLLETFPEPGQLPTRGPGGAYVHELVVPFLRHEPAFRHAMPAPAHASVRQHAPGSEWLYLKVYSGERGADALLGDWLPALLAETRPVWDRWHFVRYADPESHLRVRFHGAPDRLLSELLPRIHATLAPYLANGRCWKIQLDTYVPELERYGGLGGMAAAEELFWHDSEMVLQLLDARGRDPDARWRAGLCAVDDLMIQLGLDLDARLRLASEVREAFAIEFRSDDGLRSELGARHRQLRASLESLVFEGGDPELANVLVARAEALRPALASLGEVEARGELAVSRAHLAVQLNHMSLNRLFHSAQRAQELVLHDLLVRLYRTRLARSTTTARRVSIRPLERSVARAPTPARRGNRRARR